MKWGKEAGLQLSTKHVQKTLGEGQQDWETDYNGLDLSLPPDSVRTYDPGRGTTVQAELTTCCLPHQDGPVTCFDHRMLWK